MIDISSGWCVRGRHHHKVRWFVGKSAACVRKRYLLSRNTYVSLEQVESRTTSDKKFKIVTCSHCRKEPKSSAPWKRYCPGLIFVRKCNKNQSKKNEDKITNQCS